MKIERDPFRMEYVIRIDREEVERAFTSQDEYNALIAKLSKLIYEEERKRGAI